MLLSLYLLASVMLAFCLIACYLDPERHTRAATNDLGWYSVLGAVIVMAVPLIPMLLGSRGLLMGMIGGDLFARKFDHQLDVGWVLDQPTLHKYFFWFTILSMASLPYIVAARWLSDRRTRIGYWVPVLATVLLALCLLMFLVIPSFMLSQYIDAMGVTPMRAVGVIYTVGCVVALTAGVTWVAWKPPSNQGSNGRRK